MNAIQVTYPITEADIQTRFGRYVGLTAETPQQYKVVQAALSDLRSARTEIEKRRKELKADSLEYGKKVDAAAKFLTAQIEAIEAPLKASKAAADRKKEAIEVVAEAAPAPVSAPAQEETVTIPKSRYAELLAAQEKLWALEAAGVEKWEGYEAAMRSRL